MLRLTCNINGRETQLNEKRQSPRIVVRSSSRRHGYPGGQNLTDVVK
jgi:hypothetical protein